MDLLNATGDLAFFLGEADLEEGKYTQIRLDVIEAYGIQDGERVAIELANPVLKIVRPFDVSADQETQVVIDIDLDRSLRENPQGWKMTPVIGKVHTAQVDDEASGEDTHQEGDVVEIEGSGS